MVDIVSAFGSLPAKLDHIFLQIMMEFDFIAFDEEIVSVLVQNVEMSTIINEFVFEV